MTVRWRSPRADIVGTHFQEAILGMDWRTITVYIPYFLAGYWILLCAYRLLLHPLAKFPGPFLAKISGEWRNMKYWGMEWHDDILDLHKKYGRIVRVAPNELSVVHPDGLKQLFSFRSNTEKTEWYHTWEILAGVEVPSLFPGQDKKVQSFLRKRVAAAYSMSTVLRTEKHIQSCMDLLWRQLKKHADTGHPVDMSNWTSYLAYDVVGELAFGEKFGSLESETDVMDLVKNSLGVNFMIANIGHYPGQAWLVKNWVFETVMKWCGNKSPIEDFFTWTSRAVQDRMSDKALSKRHDMLSYFIDMKDVNGNPANFREILLETHNIV